MKKRHLNKGFTAIEALMAILVFSIISLIVTGIFARSLQLQRRANSSQRIQENALFVLESMAKEIRVSRIENQESPACTATALTNIVSPFTSPTNLPVTYQLNLADNTVERVVNAGTPQKVSTSEVRFTNLKFCIVGSGTNDNRPAKITILATIRNASGAEIVTVDLQTTVTSRNIVSELEN